MPEFLVVWRDEHGTGAEFVEGWGGAYRKVRELEAKPTRPLVFVFMPRELEEARYLALGLMSEPGHV
jgi:hypothetical protein